MNLKNEGPLVVVCLLTFQRTEYALKAIHSTNENLKYSGTWSWYIGDDGSEADHIGALLDACNLGPSRIRGFHSRRLGPGKNWNLALQTAFDQDAASIVVLWLEDDWILHSELNIDPWVSVLAKYPEVGMIRMGHLPINLDLRSVGYDGRVYLEVLKSTQYAYSGNPSLRSRSFWESYGPYPEGKTPGDTEVFFDGRLRTVDGPKILWPVAVGETPIWGHIGEVPSYEPG